MKVWAEKDAEDFLEKQRFTVAARRVVRTEAELWAAVKAVGSPVVLKVTGALHKSDKGGVKTELHTEQEILTAFRGLKKLSKAVMVHQQVEGLPVLAGLKKDPTFGHVLVFGAGGVFTEQLKDVSFRVCPVLAKAVREMIAETKMAQVLLHPRGVKYSRTALESALLKLGRLPQRFPKIQELDINPLFVTEKDAVVADARIVFG